ncbi:MAG: cysteine hydrolase [Caldisphaeraceae archaeon]|nr:cysteine hydrolase [Caldisphaeraceae archaeon]MEB3691616.1 cysteine hydrolase [Caldisphaeraceae archaeon]MEB3798005.1 cysteine hydrolase [Caldisphaeraceae archaeon]
MERLLLWGKKQVKPALLVIDILNDFVKGPLKTREAEIIINPAKTTINAFRKKGYPIFYVNDSHYKEDFEIELWGPHAMKNSRGAKVYEELEPHDSDYIIEKHTYSGFFETPLDYLLRTLRIDTVFLIGLDADICVRHTAADAFFRGYKIYVVRDAVASRIDKNWEEYFSKVYNAKIINSLELEEYL